MLPNFALCEFTERLNLGESSRSKFSVRFVKHWREIHQTMVFVRQWQKMLCGGVCVIETWGNRNVLEFMRYTKYNHFRVRMFQVSTQIINSPIKNTILSLSKHIEPLSQLLTFGTYYPTKALSRFYWMPKGKFSFDLNLLKYRQSILLIHIWRHFLIPQLFNRFTTLQFLWS